MRHAPRRRSETMETIMRMNWMTPAFLSWLASIAVLGLMGAAAVADADPDAAHDGVAPPPTTQSYSALTELDG